MSIGFPRQEYCSGLPFSPLGDLPDPESEPRSPALQADSLPELPGAWAPHFLSVARVLSQHFSSGLLE